MKREMEISMIKSREESLSSNQMINYSLLCRFYNLVPKASLTLPNVDKGVVRHVTEMISKYEKIGKVRCILKSSCNSQKVFKFPVLQKSYKPKLQ